MYVRRTLESTVIAAAKQFPIILLTGARQVGKTTLLQQLGEPNRTYITMDDPLIRQLARDDPPLFLQRFQPPLLLDEIQYAPELLPYLKMASDMSRQPGLFWLTGSQHFHAMKGVTESLAGRVGILRLLGLSRRELIGQAQTCKPFLPQPELITESLRSGGTLSLSEMYRLVWRGSMPALCLQEKANRDLFYSSYIQTYLQRDLRDLTQIGDELAFIRFLKATAARTGQILNLAELARDVGIAPNTAKQWLSILVTSGIIYLLEPYSSNLTSRLSKSPKLIYCDTGLCAYLTEWPTPETLEAGLMSGAILETWVVSEILKSYLHNGLHPPLYYYRDKRNHELDLLIIKEGTVYPLEIKKTASPTTHTLQNFIGMQSVKIPVGPGGIICLVKDWLPLSATLWAIPVGAI